MFLLVKILITQKLEKMPHNTLPGWITTVFLEFPCAIHLEWSVALCFKLLGDFVSDNNYVFAIK